MAKKKYMSNFALSLAPIDVETTVTNIIELNNVVNNKYKTVFECESKNEKPRMCVYWERSSIAIGDKVKLTGRLKNDVFLVWNMLITRKAKQNECK